MRQTITVPQSQLLRKVICQAPSCYLPVTINWHVSSLCTRATLLGICIDRCCYTSHLFYLVERLGKVWPPRGRWTTFAWRWSRRDLNMWEASWDIILANLLLHRLLTYLSCFMFAYRKVHLTMLASSTNWTQQRKNPSWLTFLRWVSYMSIIISYQPVWCRLIGLHRTNIWACTAWAGTWQLGHFLVSYW